jgi:hypothetical protein
LLEEKGLERDVKSRDQLPSIKPSRKVFRSDDEGSSSSGDESDQKSGNENGHDGGEGENDGEEKLEVKEGGEGGSPVKEQPLETNPEKSAAENSQARCCTIDKLIEAELEELGDREKVSLQHTDAKLICVKFFVCHFGLTVVYNLWFVIYLLMNMFLLFASAYATQQTLFSNFLYLYRFHVCL